MSGSKQQIRKRIEKIAEFTAELKKLKIKSIFSFMIISCFVLVRFPIFREHITIITSMIFRGNK